MIETGLRPDREGMDVTEAATQEAYDKGRRDERARIVRWLQEMYAGYYQMARQERVSWVRMALYEQVRAIGEAIHHIEKGGDAT